MRFRQGLNLAVVVLASLAGIQSASFAGAASPEATLHGHVGISGHHHLVIKQPNPPKQSIPTVNVRDFGATGNGVTDDTGAIQNAIAAAQGSGKGVLFPAGTYLHTSIIYDNGVPLIGVGAASVLLANNPNASAVVLTGVSPSIQNLVVSSALASTFSFVDLDPFTYTLSVWNSQNFVVQGITIVQGPGMPGIFLGQSAVGQVSGVTFNGTGTTPLATPGVLMDSCSNVSLVGNLFLNEGQGILVGIASPFVNSSIAIIGNTVNAVVVGIVTQNAVTVDVAQNQVQLAFQNSGNAIVVGGGSNNTTIMQNATSGGSVGLVLFSNGQSNSASQNIIRNCGSFGAEVQTNIGTGNVAFVSNQFGECGTLAASDVIALNPTGANDITVLNNVYQGHANLLLDFISSSAHLNFVSGNTQTQTNLPNNLP